MIVDLEDLVRGIPEALKPIAPAPPTSCACNCNNDKVFGVCGCTN